MTRKKSLLGLVILLAGLSLACGKGPEETKLDLGQEEVEEVIEEVVEDLSLSKEELIKTIDLSLKPNELGQVMVLMYHNIGEEEGEWTRTPENFRRDLETLYEKGYRAVSLRDYVNNTMDVEAGKTPVVITFDDGNENNFRLIEEAGNLVVDPNSAVGIMEDFKKDYEDFNTTASFFVFGENPFRQEDHIEYKLNYLIENGYDIGNHTLDHRTMKGASDPDYIQEGLGRQVEILESYLPDYKVETYALCYGERPGEDLASFLEKGSFKDISYENIAILNVGWNPSKSPLHLDFNPLSIPRIRASEMKVDNVGIYNWLDYFDNNPEKRYISDGVIEVVTAPSNLEEIVNTKALGDKELYLYDED